MFIGTSAHLNKEIWEWRPGKQVMHGMTQALPTLLSQFDCTAALFALCTLRYRLADILPDMALVQLILERAHTFAF